MATHPGMLIAYSASGEVMATLDFAIRYAEDGTPLEMVDFAAIEEAGGEQEFRYTVPGDERGDVKGSKVWPEYLGGRVHEFRVELVGPPGAKRIGALVHKVSGHRRERQAVDDAIAARVTAARANRPRPPGDVPFIDDDPPVVDIRDLVGGPDRPLRLDDGGRTIPRQSQEE